MTVPTTLVPPRTNALGKTPLRTEKPEHAARYQPHGFGTLHTMNTQRFAALLLTSLALTGCASPALAPTTTPTTAPIECELLTTQALTDLQWGLDEAQPGQTVTASAAAQTGDRWAVIADVDGTTALWTTDVDPTQPVDGLVTYLSVDSEAATLSVYAQPTDSADYLNGVGKIELEDCLP